MTDRPLWRTQLRKAIKQLKEAEAVQRAQAQELPDSVLIAECGRRGWIVTGYCQCEICQRAKKTQFDGVSRIVGEDVAEFQHRLTLGKRWPPLADEDEADGLPFEVDNNGD